MSDLAILPFNLKIKEPIKGINPTTGMTVYFYPFEPAEGRKVIVFIIGDNWYYSPDAGNTWEMNPDSIDIRQVDILVS